MGRCDVGVDLYVNPGVNWVPRRDAMLASPSSPIKNPAENRQINNIKNDHLRPARTGHLRQRKTQIGQSFENLETLYPDQHNNITNDKK